MFFWLIIIVIFLMFVFGEIFLFFIIRRFYAAKKRNLLERQDFLKEQEASVKRKVEDIEDIMSERFLFYDTTRKIAPIIDKKHLFDVFAEEIKYLGPIEKVELSETSKERGVLKFELGENEKEHLYIKTKSKAVIGYIPYFVNLLRLCLERIRLYDTLQELSIHDSLTKVHNRRYFDQRFGEEFQRAQKFKLNLAFLMVDIDRFKNINDTYGHLVGDAVLREVAKSLQEATREIDFISRFGGEEFAIILPETDKAGAIMLAERIRSKISLESIKVFDEILDITVSMGVASFPQNTVHPDVLMETADKAMYKAKQSGRNHVCWF